MIGTVTSYLSDKNYGFIKGEDGKDYFLLGRKEFSHRVHSHLAS